MKIEQSVADCRTNIFLEYDSSCEADFFNDILFKESKHSSAKVKKRINKTLNNQRKYENYVFNKNF